MQEMLIDDGPQIETYGHHGGEGIVVVEVQVGAGRRKDG